MLVKKALFSSAVLVACLSAFLALGCGSSSPQPVLAIVASNSSIAAGSTMSLKATVKSGAGVTTDVTTQTAWSSSNAQAASVSSAGLVTGLSVGNTVISGSVNGLSATMSLNVTAPNQTGLTLSPQGASIPIGLTQRYTATASYGNNTSADVSSSVTWSVAPANVATIDTNGLLTSLAPGDFTVTAVSGSGTSAINATAAGTVIDAIVTSISVTPTTLNIANGNSQQFHAMAQLSNGVTQDVTGSAQWVSSNAVVATINNEGLMQAKGIGPALITATIPATASHQAITSSAGIMVTAAVLNSVAITPANSMVAVGSTLQLTATGTNTDGTTQNLTGTAAWNSSNPVIATVNAAGLVSGVSTGTTILTAQAGGKTTSTTVTVQPRVAPTVTGIVVVPTSVRIAAGTPAKLTAIASYTDGSHQDVSSTVMWNSSNVAVASVDGTGLVSGMAIGTVTVTGQLGTFQSQTTLIVGPATLLSVALSPSSASFALGTSQQFSMIGIFSDGSTQDLSLGATWLSSAPGVATVSGSGLAQAVGVGAAQLSATSGGQTATTTAVQVTPAVLVSVALSPANPNLHTGSWQQLHVTGTFSDGTMEDVTAQATWQSSDSTIVNISATGVASALLAGTVQISATVDGMTASSSPFQVGPATLVSIAITPMTPSMALGTTQQFTAVGTYSDGTTQDLSAMAVWISSNPQVATIDQNGKAESGSLGSVQISATVGGVTATSGTVQVTPATLLLLTLTPMTMQIAKGTTQQFTASGLFTDGSHQDISTLVSWTSSDGAIVGINSNGLATGLGVGSAQLSATYLGQTVSTTAFQVTAATLASIALTPANGSVALGTTQQFTLTGTFSDGTTQNLSGSAVWSSSNMAAATISSSGLVTPVALGTTTIAAQSSGMNTTTNMTVSSATLVSISIGPLNVSLAQGLTTQFTVTGTFSNGTTQDLSSLATWSSSNSAVISVDSNGLATGVGIGSATLTATYMGLTASTATLQGVTAVLVSIAVTPGSPSVAAGLSLQYVATGTYSNGTTLDITSSVTWSTSNGSVATVNAAGLALGLSIGTANIQAQSGSVVGSVGLSVTPPVLLQVIVTPSTTSIAKGTTIQFIATAYYSDGSLVDVTAAATWQTSLPSIGSISATGLVSGLAGGVTQILGIYSGQTAVVSLTVSPANLVSLAITPSSASIADGTTQRFHAIGTLTDGSTQDYTNSVVWSSGATATATIDSTGTAATHSLGVATITAQSGGISATASLNVTSATAQSLQVTPSSLNLPAGDTQQLLATANFTDGSSQDVTGSASYTSSTPSVASVSPHGLLQTSETGTATITVALGSVSYNLLVTVTAATLQSLAITPTTINLAAGTSQQLSAIGTFSDGSTADLTNSVTWSSSVVADAAVSITGNVYAAAVGSVTIMAQSGSVTATTPVTVTAATVAAITIDPGSITLAVGQTAQLTATATLSDGTQQSVTTSANWSVSDPLSATISNVTGSNGFFTSAAAGSVTVYASLGSVVGSATVTIQAATISSLTLTPNAVSLAAGTTQMLSVVGNYSDGSTANLNASTTWSSSDLSVASVSASGLLTATGTGSATLTATVNGVSATVTVTTTSALLNSIVITPLATTVNLGEQPQFMATGTYSDSSTADITALVHWTSSSATVATISSTGLAISKGVGSATITASLSGISAQATLMVNAATLVSIAVGAGQNSFALGTSLPLTATGTYSDGSTSDFTNLVTWSSLNPAVGIVNAAGLATGVTTGSFSAKATLGTVSGTFGVAVTSAILQSITVTPANSIIINLLGMVSFVATGTFSDGTTAVLGAGVHWAISSGITLGSISQSGTFSPIALGLGTVTATYGGASGSTGFTIVGL